MNQWNDDKQLNIIAGEYDYLDFISKLHSLLDPRSYFEIGIRNGASLSLAKCKSIGVDPSPDINVELSSFCEIYEMTSDNYFEQFLNKHSEIDFSFIDGMHLIEFALRDFINIEKISHDKSLIIIDDIFPNNYQQSSRIRETRVWMGDVWKLNFILKLWRPDLRISLINTSPSGLMLITNADNKNRNLELNYDIILDSALNWKFPPTDVTSRIGAISPFKFLEDFNKDAMFNHRN